MASESAVHQAGNLTLLKALRASICRRLRARGPRPGVKVRRRYASAYQRMRASGTTPKDYVGSRNTYYFMRAAWTWGVTREMSSLMRSLGRGPDVDKDRLVDVNERIRRLLVECAAYPPDPERRRIDDEQHIGEFAKLVKNPPRPKSGRLALRGLPDDWRDQVVVAACVAKSEYGLPLAVQSACGCRGAEVELGVRVCMVNGQIEFSVRGAKFVEGRQGQEWRRITVPVAGADTLVVQEALRRIGDEMTVKVHSAKGLSWAAIYFGRKALGTRITGHMFRHQMSSDLKAEGVSRVDIAAALGHLVTRTSGNYGRPRDAKGKRGLTAIAASPVRDTVTYRNDGRRRGHDSAAKRS